MVLILESYSCGFWIKEKKYLLKTEKISAFFAFGPKIVYEERFPYM
jgi:hypothetical protein